MTSKRQTVQFVVRLGMRFKNRSEHLRGRTPHSNGPKEPRPSEGSIRVAEVPINAGISGALRHASGTDQEGRAVAATRLAWTEEEGLGPSSSTQTIGESELTRERELPFGSQRCPSRRWHAT